MTEMKHGALRPDGAGAAGLVRIEQIEAASELDGFVYIVSHDVRNSARALTEVPHWLRDDLEAQGVRLNRDLQENFELLERHAKRLDRMLLDLLIYSRVGRMQNVTRFALADLVEDVCSETSLPERVSVVCERDLPELVMGYKDAYVLLKNILDNVVRHCPGDDTVLTIRGRRRNEEVTLTFTDNGPGISEGNLQKAFRPMATLARRDEVEGSGMGLAIIQRIASHYSGDLWAGAGPDGQGLRIRLRLRDAVGSALVQDVAFVPEAQEPDDGAGGSA